jgi:hypothetical protein
MYMGDKRIQQAIGVGTTIIHLYICKSWN